MFTNLIESNSHRRDFKRRSSFFLATVAAYALILSGAGVGSIFAYDAHLEAQTDDLVLLNWVPPITPADRDRPQPARRAPANNDRVSARPVRPVLYESASNPRTPPSIVSVMAQPIPPAPPNAIIGRVVSDPPPTSVGPACITCTGNNTAPAVRVDNTAPPPAPLVKPPTTARLPSSVLISKAISLPQPPYPPLARQIHLGGAVTVQILVDEQGKVVSAQTMSGHPILLAAAKEAAMRARFTPTILSGQPVKVQGVITYNFVMQ